MKVNAKLFSSFNEIKLFYYFLAHCVSQWGHDYRPDYLKLGTLHDELNNVPCIAVTATASQQVIDDICRFLFMLIFVFLLVLFVIINIVYYICVSQSLNLNHLYFVRIFSMIFNSKIYLMILL